MSLVAVTTAPAQPQRMGLVAVPTAPAQPLRKSLGAVPTAPAPTLRAPGKLPPVRPQDYRPREQLRHLQPLGLRTLQLGLVPEKGVRLIALDARRARAALQLLWTAHWTTTFQVLLILKASPSGRMTPSATTVRLLVVPRSFRNVSAVN